jgi:hypothetical protein
MAREWTATITAKSGLVRTLNSAIQTKIYLYIFRSEDIRLTCNVHLLVNLPKQVVYVGLSCIIEQWSEALIKNNVSVNVLQRTKEPWFKLGYGAVTPIDDQ